MPCAALPKVTCRQVPRRLVTARPASSTLRLYSGSRCGFTGRIGKPRVISVTPGMRETEAQRPEDPAKAHAKVQADPVTQPHKALQPLHLHLPALRRPSGQSRSGLSGRNGKGNSRLWALSGRAASSPAPPAAHSPARPLPPLTRHFSFPSGALCNWNGTSEIVLLFKSRSLNSHIYLEPRTTTLNLLGTFQMLTWAVPNPWLSFNCKQRGFVARVSRQSRLLAGTRLGWASTYTPIHGGNHFAAVT